MKGYLQAAWRLFRVTLSPPVRWPSKVTWEDTELEGTQRDALRSARLSWISAWR